ncbi:hypothetical protein ACIQ7D_19215 [Streptomyces sp. NPDC096310]|uniref:hypothetical protein n=1 Tax=Streptomyces sp. NPDC096310 TaxID=3366082 RepID=UPI003829EE8F
MTAATVIGVDAATVIGVDGATAVLGDADHLARVLVGELALPGTASVGTHVVRSGRPHLALSLTLPDAATAAEVWRALTVRSAPEPVGLAFGERRHGPAELSEGAAHAVAERTERGAGRAVLFPGAGALTGTVEVGELLAASAVDEVALLGAAGPPDGERRILTRDHLRPEWREGRLVLTVMEAAGGVLVPFEVPDPTPCCADH